ncbi:hypothetical protein BO70DRAFT_354504 [Aspergillus heteromorphus CBS 117.55]|uniref:Uncharacterized protein n=1 Tax=Aspergillus heteromorphus CBS 117.55 TaxID=1448321 RepID=A0A317VN64_9EURO|nr:uncharacterized protein BO70DRAFT_354504 [Aspergillus heteromorphus CBS 117.55]PWY75019.1 hypothetical protein BO70DRAFT_354504 [Aspergillus heteromorphus CBS 117.55]
MAQREEIADGELPVYKFYRPLRLQRRPSKATLWPEAVNQVNCYHMTALGDYLDASPRLIFSPLHETNMPLHLTTPSSLAQFPSQYFHKHPIPLSGPKKLKEASTGIIEIERFDTCTLKCMIDYLYTVILQAYCKALGALIISQNLLRLSMKKKGEVAPHHMLAKAVVDHMSDFYQISRHILFILNNRYERLHAQNSVVRYALMRRGRKYLKFKSSLTASEQCTLTMLPKLRQG